MGSTSHTPSATSTETDFSALVRESLESHRVPERLIPCMQSTIKPQFKKSYQPVLQRWIDFAKQENFNPYNPSHVDLTDFLIMSLETHNVTIKYIGSALAALGHLLPNHPALTHPIVMGVQRSLFLKYPIKPKVTKTWDMLKVLDVLSQWPDYPDLPLNKHAQKAIMLIFLSTMCRQRNVRFMNLNGLSFIDGNMVFQFN